LADPVRTRPGERPVGTAPRSRSGVTPRAIIIGLIATTLIVLWVHYAELVLGGMRGHTAIVNTSIPVGAFNALFALVMMNILLSRIAPGWRLTPAELLTIYVMTAVATVLSSSGGMHMLIPTVTAAHYFASRENAWGELFHRFIPDWMAQSDEIALKGFYEGSATLELSRWATQMGVWSAFLIVFAFATLCLTLILRKQWIEREHLPFPTVMLPLELAKEGTPLLRNKLFWLSTGATFAIAWMNTLALNYPNIPNIHLRATDLSPSFVTAPWNAMGYTPVTFFPFAIGIGYLLSTEVVFSCWFFYLFAKGQLVVGSAAGWSQGPAGTAQSVYPYLAFQGAGAFLGLAFASIWISRRHLANVFRIAFSSTGDPDPDARGYRIAVFGLIGSVITLIAFAVIGGVSLHVSVLFVILVLVYLMAATRIRAETGNAWPAGPEVDAFRLMTSVGGTGSYHASDLTVLTYLRAATAGQDLRGVCMPNQMDGLKIADSAGISPGKLAGAMMIAVVFGVIVSFVIALYVWTSYGAFAKTDSWRSMAGNTAFNNLADWLKNPRPPDKGGMTGFGIGASFTVLLAYLRTRYIWWPFHPVGYCMANTFTSYNIWMPFMIAWLCKIMIIRAGGMKLYRKAMPFFLGLIAGDFLGGGTTTLVGCFTSISVYPVNW
jgi:hypothetical protein